MLTVNQAKRKLKRKLNQKYSKQEQQELLFYPDRSTLEFYSWIFEDKVQKLEWTCCLRTGVILTIGN
ncbi:hypothetical protein ACFYKX_25610 [Cytobacillus sp. FJAT-54145]|uniref:Uncharacterized protein n=1 Tax=Cytobacillus spartinae TaxID=3299023 RepID=A0ABW6KID5_9BACI